MTQIGLYPAFASRGPLIAANAARRVEEIRETAESYGKFADEAEQAARKPERSARSELSHCDTVETAPLWYGPRLRAPFVAQILGQILPGAENGRSMGTLTYAPAAKTAPLAFDEQA